MACGGHRRRPAVQIIGREQRAIPFANRKSTNIHGMTPTRLPFFDAPRRPSESPLDPGIAPGRSKAWAQPRREPVEIGLDPDIVEFDITYVDQSGQRSERRIKPEALRVLRLGEISLVATCRLRGERRSFAFSQIESATLPGLPGPPMTGDRLIQLFADDVERLMSHDETINGAVIRPARLEPEPATSKLMLSDAQIDEEVIDPSAAGPQERSEAAVLEALCGQITDFTDAILTKGAHGRMGVTTTLRMKDGETKIHIDVPTWVANSIQDSSAHARMAYMGRKRDIMRAAEAVMRRLIDEPCLGHDNLTVRLLMTRTKARKSISFWLAIDGVWINLKPNAPATIGQKIRKAVRRMEAEPGLAPLAQASPNWMIDTTEGVFRVRGTTSQNAVSRLIALLGRDQISVLGVGQMVEPAAADANIVRTG